MNTQRVRQLQQCIDAEQRKVEEARKVLVAQPYADENELASHYESMGTSIVLMQRAQERLAHLNLRMAVIQTRPHALCAECGETISLQRLAAVPDAVRCTSCQNYWEDEHQSRPFQYDAYDNIPQYA